MITSKNNFSKTQKYDDTHLRKALHFSEWVKTE